MNTILGLAAVVLLVLANAFFVAVEFALVGARRTRIDQLATQGHLGARIARRAIENLDSYMAATQLGITLASLGLGWIGEATVGHLIEGLIALLLPAEHAASVSHTLAFPISFGIVTSLHIVFGELAPKSIALQQPEGTSVLVAPFARIFHFTFFPVIWLMNTIGNTMLKWIGFSPASEEEQVHSPEELAMLVRASREAGILQQKEELLLSRALSFHDIPLENVMQPRVDVVAFPLSISRKELLRRLPQHRFSRFVIYRENIDDVLGILHLKDLFDILAREDAPAKFDLQSLLHDPLFLPASAPISAAMQEMQRKKAHFVVVLDEFGGTAGVATLEDILEELVGEVQDEFDRETPSFREEGGAISVDGGALMSEIEERFGPAPPEIESNTIGGYIAEALGRIPLADDCVPYGAYEVRVMAMDELRVARVSFTKQARNDSDS